MAAKTTSQYLAAMTTTSQPLAPASVIRPDLAALNMRSPISRKRIKGFHVQSVDCPGGLVGVLDAHWLIMVFFPLQLLLKVARLQKFADGMAGRYRVTSSSLQVYVVFGMSLSLSTIQQSRSVPCARPLYLLGTSEFQVLSMLFHCSSLQSICFPLSRMCDSRTKNWCDIRGRGSSFGQDVSR